jgi:hypothetical protein
MKYFEPQLLEVTEEWKVAGRNWGKGVWAWKKKKTKPDESYFYTTLLLNHLSPHIVGITRIQARRHHCLFGMMCQNVEFMDARETGN